jgi:hypothetical protein
MLSRASRRFLACALLLLVGLAASAQPAGPKPTRILFIGNALTASTDIPARLEKLANAMGRRATVESVTADDQGLEDHWRDGRAAAAIRKGWDVVVLQQGSSIDAQGRARLLEYTRRFAEPIRAAGAKPALFMVWPPAERLRDFGEVIKAYRAAASATDAILLPVGEAWLRAISVDRKLRLYSGSTSPSTLGSDLAVLTIYLALFPAGHQEFDEAFVAKAAKALEMPGDRRDLLFDAATRAIDEPMALE